MSWHYFDADVVHDGISRTAGARKTVETSLVAITDFFQQVPVAN